MSLQCLEKKQLFDMEEAKIAEVRFHICLQIHVDLVTAEDKEAESCNNVSILDKICIATRNQCNKTTTSLFNT